MGISNAAEPSYALVGGSATTAGDPEVAFVRKVNGHEHVFVSTVQTSTGGGAPAVRDLTPDASSDCSSPAISPDGRSVAYSTSGGVFVVGVNGGGAPKQVTDVPGFPVFRG
jgi:Tol biopolymer transport system component